MKFRLSGGVKRVKKGISRKLKQFNQSKAQKQIFSVIAITGLLFGSTPNNALADTALPKPVVAEPLPYSLADSTLAFDQTKVYPLTVKMPETISMQIGDSRATEAARTAAKKAAVKAQSSGTMQVQSLKSADPGFDAKRALAQKAAATYGVPWEIVEAVWQIESGKSWDTAVHSSAGAQGPAQFMPGTWKRYGVDANGDGVASINNAVDAVYGASHYLAANGAANGDVHRALLAYNHAEWYVTKVLTIARSIGYTG